MGATLSLLWNIFNWRRHLAISFEYPSSLDKSSLRLLTFVRPKWYTFGFERPRLLIRTYTIDSVPKYVALSYTWGPSHGDASTRGYNEDDKVPLLLNGQVFSIYPNLLDALYGMRRKWDFDDDVQHLWIDAICINQNDLSERAAQVEIMNQIYKRSSSTVVWLGKGDSQTPAALQLYKSILKIPPEDFAPYYHQYPSILPPPNEFWLSRGLPSLVNEQGWAPLLSLFENRWFSRTWVIQEVTLSRDIIILWGRGGMTWDSLGHVALAGRTARIGQAQALPTLSQYLSGDGEQGKVEDWVVHDPLTNIIQLWGNRHRYLGQNRDLFDEMQSLCGSTSATASSWLMYFALVNRWAGATDPRDKVFGFLGLLGDIVEGSELSPIALSASYVPTITSTQVYERAMTLLIEDTDSLAVLMAVSDFPSQREGSLPSWVPDLARQQGLDLMWSIRPQFRAYEYDDWKTTSGRRRVTVEGRQLLVTGTTVGEVTELGCSLTDLMGRNWHIWTNQLLKVESEYPFTSESRVEAFWRTLLMNSVARRCPADPRTGDMFGAYIQQCLARYFPGAKASDKEHESFLQIIENINNLSRTDSSGYMPSFRGMNDLTAQIAGVTEEELEYLSNDDIIEALTRCVEKMSTFLSGMDSSMVNRRIVFSHQGHFANVPMWTEIGDIITILSSCPCPLVLRRDKKQPSYFRIVGSAYVHGIMYGESISNDTQWEDMYLI